MSSPVVKLKLPTRIQPEVMPQPGKEGVYTNQMHYIKRHLLDELTKKKFAQDFLQPVDAEELHIPHYYNVIQRPMDLGTMRKRVENNYYQDVEGVIQDFHLIIHNCRQFNGQESSTYRKCVQLEKFFQRVIGNLPKGPPVPCKKDPGSTSRATTSTSNPMEMSMEEKCRQQLQRLKTATNQADAVARNFFGPKWESFYKKLEKKAFKSEEDFRSQVEGLFRKYQEQAKMIYEKAYDQPGGYPGAGDGAPGIPISSALPNSDVEALIGLMETTEHRLMQCVQRPQRDKSLLEGFRDTVAVFKQKFQDIQTAGLAQDLPNDLDEDSKSEARFRLPTKKTKLLAEDTNGDISDDEVPVEDIDEAQRCNIQMKFGKLPVSEMRHILAMVDSSEGINRDAQNKLSFDLKSFQPQNAKMMKEAVAKSLKMEKEGLRCRLKTQLSDITQRLGQRRRKNEAAPQTGDKVTGDTQKRGHKRANSKSPPSQVTPRRGPAPFRGKSPLQATPELPTCFPPAGRAPRPGGSTSFQGGPRPGPAPFRGISPLQATPELPTCFPPAGRAPRPGGSASFQGSPRREPAPFRGKSPLQATPELPSCTRPAGRAPRPGGSTSFQGGRVPVKPGPRGEGGSASFQGGRVMVKPGNQGEEGSSSFQGGRVPVKPGPRGEGGSTSFQGGRVMVKPGNQGEGGSSSFQGGRVTVKPGPQEPNVNPGLPKPTFYSPPRSAQAGARAGFQGGRTAKTLGSPGGRSAIKRGKQIGRTPKTPSLPVGRTAIKRPGGRTIIKHGYQVGRTPTNPGSPEGRTSINPKTPRLSGARPTIIKRGNQVGRTRKSPGFKGGRTTIRPKSIDFKAERSPAKSTLRSSPKNSHTSVAFQGLQGSPKTPCFPGGQTSLKRGFQTSPMKKRQDFQKRKAFQKHQDFLKGQPKIVKPQKKGKRDDQDSLK